MNVKLIQARKTSGLTQVQLAEKVGVTQAMISKYENGCINPSFEVAYKISSILQVPMEIFVVEQAVS